MGTACIEPGFRHSAFVDIITLVIGITRISNYTIAFKAALQISTFCTSTTEMNSSDAFVNVITFSGNQVITGKSVKTFTFKATNTIDTFRIGVTIIVTSVTFIFIIANKTIAAVSIITLAVISTNSILAISCYKVWSVGESVTIVSCNAGKEICSAFVKVVTS